MLQLDAIRSGYGAIDVLQGVDLHVRADEIVAILGPNGAGKSVLLKTIAGTLACRAGRIRFKDEDITALDAAGRSQRGLAILPQQRAVFPSLSVEENLLMGLHLERDRAARSTALARAAYARYPTLVPLRRSRAGSLSGGQQKLLGIARAMMSGPRMLLLDEPSIGLDPKTLRLIANEVHALAEAGIAIVLVEQNVRFALRVARRACFLDGGRIAADGPAERFTQERDLLDLYFGKGSHERRV